MPRATIDDVALRSGFSVATVSRALRGLPNVAPETRERVKLVAAELDYEAHAPAARLASGRTMTVGLVAPLFGLWYSGQVMAGVEGALSAHGYDLLVHAVETSDGRARFISRSRGLHGRVDGAILVDFFADDEQVAALRRTRVPLATIGERIEGFTSFTIDNRTAAADAVTHLIGLGHTRIGLISSDPIPLDRSPVPEGRRNGYIDAHLRAGLPAPDPTIDAGGGNSVLGGAQAVERLLLHPDAPSAVFCTSDEMAMGALGRAREVGLRVPGDLSVIGFDDHDLAEPFGLTTMRQPVRAVGEEATLAILREIGDATLAPTNVVSPVTLVVRSTTGPRTIG